MAGKKAVLNVTVDESIAEGTRLTAATEGTTISSVVEKALAEYLRLEQIRLDGLAAMEELFQEEGYPTPEERAAARAEVEEAYRALDEARRARAERLKGSATRDNGTAA